MAVRKRIGRRVVLTLAITLYKIIAKLLFSSCRIETAGMDILEDLKRRKQPYIAAFWHHGIFYIRELGRDLPLTAMVSASEDGEYIARLLESSGFETVRGSSNRGGIAALKSLIAAVRERGRIAAIVADGSQGPPLTAQAGAVLLAGKTGAPIVPLGWGANRYIAFRSWDRTVLPKPFSRIAVKVGEPLTVPAGLKAAGIEEYRLKLEKNLKENYREVWGRFGIKSH
ncbi:MAG: lysophospholipid acyltransferase family protein [Desulfobulbales bacterium]|nr:lysophospholipid acyltransferase family protein [Desulfobulbales bacterium]